MSRKQSKSSAYENLLQEINATSGQLRYDPISYNLYLDLSEDERKKIVELLLDKLEGNDERITTILLNIEDLNFNVEYYIQKELESKERPVSWKVSAVCVLYRKTNKNEWLEKIIDFICDKNLPISIRRMAFSFVADKDIPLEMKNKLSKVADCLDDLPLKIRINKFLDVK